MRNELSRYWARFDCFLNIQPLDQIMQYFGATTAIYFAWVWVFRIVKFLSTYSRVLTHF